MVAFEILAVRSADQAVGLIFEKTFESAAGASGDVDRHPQRRIGGRRSPGEAPAVFGDQQGLAVAGAAAELARIEVGNGRIGEKTSFSPGSSIARMAWSKWR